LSYRDYSRREFLSRSLAGLSLAGLPAWYAREAEAAVQENVLGQPAKVDANSQINVAVIGPGGAKGGFRQGLGVTRGMARKPGVKVIAACDVDKTHAEEAAKAFGPDCTAYGDYREVLARKDVDAVVIGTPDHWHAIITIHALNAGKDVYCEKPLTLFVEEGRKVAQAVKRRNRILQVGSQQRSDARFRLACELVRNGRIGKIKSVEARLPNGARGGPFAVAPPPSDLNWDFWLGPAPFTDYIKERTHGSFRHWYEYSGGMMTDWGAHHLDITQWALGADEAGPIRVESEGVVPANSRGFNCATDFKVTYTYPDNITVVATHQGENGVRFEGESGWIFVSRGKIEASDMRLLSDPLSGDAKRLYVSNDHIGNFVDSVRSRKETICTAEIGHRSCTVCHLGNISLRLGGRALDWDPEKERFKGDDEANKMLTRPYRKPYTV
jgi:predicted dehydrogenase